MQQRFSHFQLAEMAWAAGKCAVQYRNKHFVGERDFAEAQAIAELANTSCNYMFVNDSTSLAFELKAQGVHLGQGDGDPYAAAKLLGPNRIIGATVHSMAELLALEGAPIHYIGVGPVFGTRSKTTGLPDLGLEGLARICAASPWSVIAIGGIGISQIKDALKAGAYGVAIVSEFCLASNPTSVAKSILTILENH